MKTNRGILSIFGKTDSKSYKQHKLYLCSSGRAILYPVEVNHTETLPGYACKSMVIVFINVWIKRWVHINVIPICTQT